MKVTCDTCGMRAVEVESSFDGTEWVACAVCLGDEPVPPSERETERAIRIDQQIHEDIEERGAA